MSSQTTFSPTAVSLSESLMSMYRFGGPILIVIGTVSSMMHIVLFLRRDFHQYPSSIYLVARNVSNLCFIYFAIFYETLAIGYRIVPSASDLVCCRFSTYTALLFDVLNPFYLLLTVLDRLWSRSCATNKRTRSTHRLAYKLSIGGVLLWALLHIHTLFYAAIVQTETNFLYCYYQPVSYATLIMAYSLTVKGVLAPTLLLSLGWMMVKNYRKRCRLVSVVGVAGEETDSASLVRSRDREIVFILVKDIAIYILFSSISSMIFMYELITQYHAKDGERVQIEYYIRYMGIFCVSVPFCVGFYTNLLISRTFRREVQQLLSCQWRRRLER